MKINKKEILNDFIASFPVDGPLFFARLTDIVHALKNNYGPYKYEKYAGSIEEGVLRGPSMTFYVWYAMPDEYNNKNKLCFYTKMYHDDNPKLRLFNCYIYQMTEYGEQTEHLIFSSGDDSKKTKILFDNAYKDMATKVARLVIAPQR